MRDDYAAEARDEHVTKLDNVLYIIIALVNIKTSKYLSKTNEVWNKARGSKKIHNPYLSFDIIIFAIYSNNRVNMIACEIPEFFQFPKLDIPTARCKCAIYIITYLGIKVVIRTEFINMTVILSMWAVLFNCFFLTWSWIQFFFKINSSCYEKLLYSNVRNWIGFPASWVSV